MTYDNKQLCKILNDKQQTLAMANAFLDKMKGEIKEKEEEEFVAFHRGASGAHYKRLIDIIWACAESPIERIFISSLMMNFIRNHDPLGFVITVPMSDAERNMSELRQSIADMKDAISSRTARGNDVLFPSLFQDLEAAVKAGKVPKDQYDLNFHMIWCYHFLDLTGNLHLTPQAAFPSALPSEKGVRTDLLFWMPKHRDFRVIVECDSYQYHDNKESFDYDRQRSRVLQRLGFKVLQYSGGEICKDPIRTSFELYDYFMNDLESFYANKEDA